MLAVQAPWFYTSDSSSLCPASIYLEIAAGGPQSRRRNACSSSSGLGGLVHEKVASTLHAAAAGRLNQLRLAPELACVQVCRGGGSGRVQSWQPYSASTCCAVSWSGAAEARKLSADVEHINIPSPWDVHACSCLKALNSGRTVTSGVVRATVQTRLSDSCVAIKYQCW
jgi:hypothetical protein